MFVGHVNRQGHSLHQRIPFPLDIIGSRFENNLMAVLGRLTDTDWLYRYGITRSLLDFVANRLVIPLVHGEVLTLEEIENLINRLHREGHLMAIGICECRHGEKRIETGLVEGVDPNYTCVMIGDWGKAHLYTYPQYYRPVEPDELIEKARFWHSRGRILTSWGCSTIHGFLASYCHCLPEYCVPLRNQIKRGNKVFLPGYSYAAIDPETCLGPENCEFDCSRHCFFDAISVVDGKARVDTSLCYGCGQCFTYCPSGAATRIEKKGYNLSYCPPDLVSPQ